MHPVPVPHRQKPMRKVTVTTVAVDTMRKTPSLKTLQLTRIQIIQREKVRGTLTLRFVDELYFDLMKYLDWIWIYGSLLLLEPN